jgi:transcriptional regulator with XRE-family HTH domain
MSQTFGERARRALLRLQADEGAPITLADLGERVAQGEGRAEPYTATAVSRWLNDKQEPTLAVVAALARVLKVEPGVLAFGDHTNGHTPRQPARPDIASGTPGQEVNRVEGLSPAARAREDAARKRGRKRNGA